MGKFWTVSVLIVGSLAFMGCADKAQPKYDECVALEGKGDLKGAVVACEAAVAASPESKAGKAAADKVTALKAAIKKQEEEAAAKAEAERKRAEAARQAAAAEAARVKLQNSICANLDAWSLDDFLGAKCGQAATRLSVECVSSLPNLGPASVRTHEMPQPLPVKQQVFKVQAKFPTEQVTKMEAILKTIREHAEGAGEADVRKSLIADYERLIAVYKAWARAMEGYAGDLAPFLAAKQAGDKAGDTIGRNDQQRAQQCVALAQPK